MNQNIFKVVVVLFFICIAGNSSLSAQVAQIDDPLISHKNYVSIGTGLSVINFDPNYRGALLNGTTFEATSSINDLKSNGGVEVGHAFVIKGKNKNTVLKLTTGASVQPCSVNIIKLSKVSGSSTKYYDQGSDQVLRETFVEIPLKLTLRIPLVIMQPQSRYHALEVGIGALYASNVYRETQFTSNVQYPNKRYIYPANQYADINTLAEVSFSFLSPKGCGHKFGIRATHGTGYYTSITDVENPLVYNSLGVFYSWTFLSF